MSSVFPQYFKGAETFEILISFLKDEDEIVGKNLNQCLVFVPKIYFFTHTRLRVVS